MSSPEESNKKPKKEPSDHWMAQAWRESHGNLLLAISLVILIAGLIVIWLAPPSAEDEGPPMMEANNGAALLPENAILLRVTTDSDNTSGPIRIAIYDSEDAFRDVNKALLKQSIYPANQFVVWEIERDLLPPKFSVSAYHDLDDDGELGRGPFSKPTEPYGFSNNARPLLGPPSYADTLVTKPTGPALIELRVF